VAGGLDVEKIHPAYLRKIILKKWILDIDLLFKKRYTPF